MDNPENSLKLLVKPKHLRQCGYCLKGSRVFFESQGIDWKTFVRHGIAVEVLEAIDDSMIKFLIKTACDGK